MDVRYETKFEDGRVLTHYLGTPLDYNPQMPPVEYGQAVEIKMTLPDLEGGRVCVVPIPRGAVPVCYKRKIVDQGMNEVGASYRVGWNLMGRRYMISVCAESGNAVLLCDDKGKTDRGRCN